MLELLSHERRVDLVSAITDLMTPEVIAELNDYVRDDMMEALPPGAVADIAEQLDTDDAVQLIKDLEQVTGEFGWHGANLRSVLEQHRKRSRRSIASRSPPRRLSAPHWR